MNKRQLGKSDLLVSEVSFGCMSLHGDIPENSELIHKAIDHGINLFDTADLYDKGENESIVGKALKTKRHSVYIATKVGNQWRNDGSGWDWNPRKSYILEAVEGSLKRLQTDYIDLYQLHGGIIEDPIDETIEAFEILKSQGKIKHYGISSIRPNVIREYVKKSNIVSVMMQYSLLDRRPEEEALPLLQKEGIGILARGSLAQGLLVDKTPKPFLDLSEQEVSNAATVIRLMGNGNRNNAQTTIGFVLAHPAVTSAVVGVRTLDQLNDICKQGTLFNLEEKEIDTLKNAVVAKRYNSHR